MRGITEDERALVQHVTRWGSDGYPVRRVGRHWHVDSWRSVPGFPCVFRTKRDAVAAFERFHEVLLDALAGRV